jgi:hypothetical protein
MQKEFVVAKVDVFCSWTGPHPIYRCYVNDELFAERTWIWHDHYLEESLQILAKPGMYKVQFELVEPHHAKIKVRNLRVEHGPAIITKDKLLQIYMAPKDENT